MNLDGIEDMSDYDVESIKNTSARAITFNQFEQTKNNLRLGNQSNNTNSAGHDTAGHVTGSNADLDKSSKANEKLNCSNIELITGATEIASAQSSERRVKNLSGQFGTMRKSLGLNDDKAKKTAMFENKKQPGGYNSEKKLGPYAMLDDDKSNH